MTTLPKPGTVVYIGPACGAPYTFRPLLFAVIDVTDHQPHADGAWLVGYEVTEAGYAIARREIYVGILAGIREAAVQKRRFPAQLPAGPTRPPTPAPAVKPDRTRYTQGQLDAAVLRLHTEGRDDRTIAYALEVHTTAVRDSRKRQNLPPLYGPGGRRIKPTTAGRTR